MQQVISWNDFFFFCFIKSLLLGSCRATASSGTQDQANGPPNTGPHQLVPLPPSIFYLLSVYHLYPCPNILLLYGKIKGSHSNHCCYFYLHKVSWTKQDSKADSFETVQDKTFFFFLIEAHIALCLLVCIMNLWSQLKIFCGWICYKNQWELNRFLSNMLPNNIFRCGYTVTMYTTRQSMMSSSIPKKFWASNLYRYRIITILKQAGQEYVDKK